MVREVLLEKFQDGCYGDHLGNQNIKILACCPDASYQVLLQLDIWLEVLLEKISRCQDGCYGDHLGNQNIVTILAVQNLHVSLMHLTKFQKVRSGPEVIKLFSCSTEHKMSTAHKN